MTFALTIVGLVAAGYALLALAGLRTARPIVDVPLAWFAGSGWFALVTAALRLGAGVPYTAVTAAGVVLLPVAGWAGLAYARRRAAREDPKAQPAGAGPADASRWLPRPWWAYAPLAAYVAFVAIVTLLQGFGTPTNTDDGIRVRAFTPVLAFEDAWAPAARALFSSAGAIPTFVPSFAWRLTGAVDPFHPNYVVLADFVAFLTLTVAIPAIRGAPERGWAAAFAALSLPLFVYHCTTTYQDAVLAIFVAVGFLWTLEYARTGDGADARRALLVLAAALMVKREGRLVALVAALPLVARMAWERRRGGLTRRTAIVAAAAGALVLATIVATAGAGHALPFLEDIVARFRGGAGAEGPPAGQVWAAFVDALLSGNQGVLYWILPLALLLRPRLLARPGFWLPLATAGLVFALAAASSLWLYPAYTVDQSTVHRSLIAASLMLSLWLAGVVVEPAAARDVSRSPEVERATPRRRRR